MNVEFYNFKSYKMPYGTKNRTAYILRQTDKPDDSTDIYRGLPKKRSSLQKWLTWFIMTINKENVNKSCVFVLA